MAGPESIGRAKRRLHSLKDTSCGICGFGRLKSWQVQKVMRNTSSLVLKNISTLILSQVE
uniref:Up-regulated during skeletal muscle growth 5 homolog n=1 Tax=Pan troglodytes TaxID=9598 RepID=K7CZE7_PANTR